MAPPSHTSQPSAPTMLVEQSRAHQLLQPLDNVKLLIHSHPEHHKDHLLRRFSGVVRHLGHSSRTLQV